MSQKGQCKQKGFMIYEKEKQTIVISEFQK